MISEGSCDTGEIMLKIQLCITGINQILYVLKKKSDKLNSKNILQYYCFYCIFIKQMQP